MDTLNHNLNQEIEIVFPKQITSERHSSTRGKLRHESEWIRKRQAQNILNATDFAEWSGTPLNRYVVILLNDTIQQSSTTAANLIIRKFTVWLAYKRKIGVVDCRPIYTFTHENPNDNPHINICFHVPPVLIEEFNLKLPRWIALVQGKLDEYTLSEQPILTNESIDVARYTIKGINPDYVDRFGLRRLHDRKGPQGTIYGQRAGFSRALGPRAMDKAGFSPMKYYRSKKH